MSTSQHGRLRDCCLPLADWPAADRLAWTAALQPADIFDAVPRPVVRWRPSTQAMIERGYGRWLTWLGGQGRLGPDATPASRATRDQVAAYAADLATMGSDYTVVARVNQLGDALRAMAPGGVSGAGSCAARSAWRPRRCRSGTSRAGCARHTSCWRSACS